jgi:predicted nucleic acid-binding protein
VKYLLDANVLREIRARGHKNVRAWLATVNDNELCLSVLTIKECQEGITRARAKKLTDRANEAQAHLDNLIAAYREHIIPIDKEIAEEWGRLVGTKNQHNDDMALAATARVRKLVLVTRNVKDFRGRGVQVLDPFKANPKIVTV